VCAELVEEELVDANMAGCHGLPAYAALDVASARRLVRDGAAHPVAVDSLQGMLVSAEPPAGEEDAGSIFFTEYFAFSKL